MMRLMFVLMTLTLFSCDNKECCVLPEVGDQLIFGTFYGECSGDCVQLYLLSNEALYADDNAVWLDDLDNPSFLSAALSESRYVIAKAVLVELPQELLEAESQSYGCPDCSDQGGYLIRWIPQNGENIKTWRLDRSISELPEHLQAYAQRLEEVMIQLR